MIIKRIPITDETPCPIKGKYHNVPLGKVPSSYLIMFSAQTAYIKRYPSVFEYINQPRIKAAIYQDIKNKKQSASYWPPFEYDIDEHEH